MNALSPLLRRVCGYSPESGPVTSSSISEHSVGVPVAEDVPVPCAALPRTTFRSRLAKLRQRRDETSSDVQKALGESEASGDDSNKAAKKSLIPKDAEDLDDTGDGGSKKLNKLKSVVMEPSDPYGEKEERMTPTAALVAPDATPNAFEPIDPSKVPGAKQGKFTLGDLNRGQKQAAPAGSKPPALAGQTMPVPREIDKPERVVTADEAYAMLRVPSPGQQYVQEDMPTPSGDALLKQGQPIPEHKHASIETVMSAFRRFAG